MRPRKVIVLVDSNEQTLSQRAFMLDTRGYCVIRIETPQAALDYLRNSTPGAVDLLITELSLGLQMDGNELVRRAKVMLPELKTLLISTIVAWCERGAAANVFLAKDRCTPAEILYQTRILVAKKRGPKSVRARILREQNSVLK